MRNRRLPYLLLLSFAACWPGDDRLDYSGGTFQQHLDLAGTTREFIVHVPPDLDPGVPVPVVVAFHGAEDSADGMMLLTWLNGEARRKGFVAVYPDSDGGRWALGSLTDVAFVDQILERIADRISIDRDRVISTGFSNGALMALWLACNRPDQMAGVGIVGGSIPLGFGCSFPRPIPAAFILGNEDRQFPFEEGSASISGQLSAEASADWWIARNGCTTERVVVDLEDRFDDGTSAHRWDHPGCMGSQFVVFHEIRGGGHTWPGSPIRLPAALGRKSLEIKASEIVADLLDLGAGGS